MSTMVERLRDAQNAHDAEQMAALFADDYDSSQPVHPGRAFSGRAQVRENWTAVFEGVPDFESHLVSSSIEGDNEWAEWDWRGRHVDGSPFLMRGVTILIIRDGLIAAARLYVEPVEDAGEDIDTAVRELYRPPSADESGSSVDDSQSR